MNKVQESLEVRISIVMLREKLNFLSTIKSFQVELKRYFDYEYTLDEIENALHSMEETFIDHEAQEEYQIIELPEDYNY